MGIKWWIRGCILQRGRKKRKSGWNDEGKINGGLVCGLD
jgi:hypothetical protein